MEGANPSARAATPRYEPGPQFMPLGDGRLGNVVASRRLTVTGDAQQFVDPSAVDDLFAFQRLPDPLGGGYLFVGRHMVRFAATFDGALTTIAIVSPRSEELRVGVGRSEVLVGSEVDAPTLYELPSGRPKALAPPSMVELFGTPSGVVSARTSTGEVYVSMSKGTPLTKATAPPVSGLRYDGTDVLLATQARSLMRVGQDGVAVPVTKQPMMTVSRNLDAFQQWSFADLGKRPPSGAEQLTGPFTRRMDASTAVLIHKADLLFLDAHTGATTVTLKDALANWRNYFLIRGGTPSFAGCNDRGVTILRIDSPGAAPIVERMIPGAYNHDFGNPPERAPLVLPKPCDGRRQPGVFCIRSNSGEWTDRPPPPDPNGLLARVTSFVWAAASEDGSAYGFAWLDGGGDLIVVDSRANKVRRIGRGPFVDIRWDAMSVEAGTVRFITPDGVLALLPDDTIRVTKTDPVLVAWRDRALVETPDGRLRETLDAGRSFHDIESPPGGVPIGPRVCWEGGCSLGPWIRVGWGPAT